MLPGQVNYLGVVVGASAAWVFGVAWFWIFVGRWADALGKSPDQIRPVGRRTLPVLALSFVGDLAMAVVLARLIPIMGEVSVLAGLMTGGLCWFGFVLTTIVVDIGYAGERRKLIAVASWHWLGVMLVMGAVIGAFR
jgi:hypothetical protein